MVATPIMRWLESVDGPVGQYNQTVVVQAPAGVSEADVVAVLQALVDRHAMLRLRVNDDGAGGGRCRCPRWGRWMCAAACRWWRSCPMNRWCGAVAAEPGRWGHAQCGVGGGHRPVGVDRFTIWPLTGCRGESCWRT